MGAANNLNDVLFSTGLAGPPVAIAVAMLRHQLFDVEFALNRTIVFVVLSAIVVGVYLGVVVAVGSVAPSSTLGVVLVAVVAVVAASGRSIVQAGVDRWLFGHRRDPYAVVARVGRHVAPASEPQEALQRLVDALRDALRLPYVAFQGAVTVTSGEAVDGWHIEPVFALGQQVGELHAGFRKAGERFSAEEKAAIAEVGSRAATLAYAASLVDDVAQSRARIVLAREEERRRLRADLHDGVGPALAGTAHQMDALARRMSSGPPDLHDRAVEIRERLREVVGDVRAVTHGLRPPVLDHVGLDGALRRLVDGFDVPECTVSIEALGDLPAAVEVAAYAIASEAVSNAVRHSAAGRVHLRRPRGVRLPGRQRQRQRPRHPGPTARRSRPDEHGGAGRGGRWTPRGAGSTRRWHDRPRLASVGDAMTVSVLIVDDHPVFLAGMRAVLDDLDDVSVVGGGR